STPAASYVYDSLGEVYQATLPSGALYTHNHQGPTHSVCGPNSFIRCLRTVDDGRGRVLKSSQTAEIEGAFRTLVTTYTYGAFGLLQTIKDTNGNITQVTHDDAGRRVALDDPDTHHSDFRVNGFDEVIHELDGASINSDYVYDQLGRPRFVSSDLG